MTVDFFKVRSFLFNRRKLACLIVIIEGFTDHLDSVPAFLQSSVIEFTAKPESSFNFSLLGFGREYSELVGYTGFHYFNLFSSALTSQSRMFCIVSPVKAWSIRKVLSVSTNTFMVTTGLFKGGNNTILELICK